MAMHANVLAIILSVILLTEQRNIGLRNGEDVLLEANRSLEDDVTTPGLAQDTLADVFQQSGSSNSEDSAEFSTTEDTVSTETVTEITSEVSSTTAGSQREPVDFYGIFLQAVMRSPGDIVAKRSVNYGDGVEDLDTAANTVFRPLFVYRQQNARRRRLRHLNVF